MVQDQDGTGIAKLQADVSSIQSEVKSLGQSMLQMAQSMQEIKALLGQQNPPDRARAVGQFMPLPTMVEGQQMQSDEVRLPRCGKVCLCLTAGPGPEL
eukprot:3322751-Rhodomonas_salina.2